MVNDVINTFFEEKFTTKEIVEAIIKNNANNANLNEACFLKRYKNLLKTVNIQILPLEYMLHYTRIVHYCTY